jgi:TonB family protein
MPPRPEPQPELEPEPEQRPELEPKLEPLSVSSPALQTEPQSLSSSEPPALPSEPQIERKGRRKRCPKCNAIYNSDLLAYCAHHFIPLIDEDEPPIISEPPKNSPVMFWMIIVITLTGSVAVGSILTALFYTTNKPPSQTASSSAATAVQKGAPTVGPELDGKVLSLPDAECPLNGQEAIPGTVIVRVVINKTGRVTSARASGGDWLLRGAANEAAMKSTFSPEKLRGRETEGTITYTFEP